MLMDLSRTMEPCSPKVAKSGTYKKEQHCFVRAGGADLAKRRKRLDSCWSHWILPAAFHHARFALRSYYHDHSAVGSGSKMQ